MPLFKIIFIDETMRSFATMFQTIHTVTDKKHALRMDSQSVLSRKYLLSNTSVLISDKP